MTISSGASQCSGAADAQHQRFGSARLIGSRWLGNMFVPSRRGTYQGLNIIEPRFRVRRGKRWHAPNLEPIFAPELARLISRLSGNGLRGILLMVQRCIAMQWRPRCQYPTS